MMKHITAHTVRTLDQEIDTILICPTLPDYVVLGTYSLVKQGPDAISETSEEDGEPASTTTSRIGSIRILSIRKELNDLSMKAHDEICRMDFACAILDIRFCPTDSTLLCAATSVGDLLFFRLVATKIGDEIDAQSIHLAPLGKVEVNERNDEDEEESNDENTTTPLITQISWIDNVPQINTDSKIVSHSIAACDTKGHASLIQVAIPNTLNGDDETLATNNQQNLPYSVQLVHKHLFDLEAWTIATISIPTSLGDLCRLVISGGDDSCFIASMYKGGLQERTQADDPIAEELNLESPPIRVCLDRQTHSAGVVAILPLPDMSLSNPARDQPTSMPILTGSYDQYLRLAIMDTVTLKFKFASELELEGGVWRILLMETYKITSEAGDIAQHYILLISCMHAGCYIVRLVNSVLGGDEAADWTWSIEARFTKPHESMVYASAARRVDNTSDRDGTWEIISTSFYDKRICIWSWTDDTKIASYAV